MKKLTTLLAILSIALPQTAIAITYNSDSLYKTTINGVTKIVIAGSPNSQVTYTWQPPTPVSGVVPPIKSKTITLNACGFKAVNSATFPASIGIANGTTAPPPSGGLLTANFSQAPINQSPLCRKQKNGSYAGYIPQGWEQ